MFVPFVVSLLLCEAAALNNDTVQKAPFLHLPVFVHSRLPLVYKGFFYPTAGTGLETLPEPVREILLPVRPGTGEPRVPAHPVSTRCDRNKMRVQVQRSVFGPGSWQYHLRLGTCNASKYTSDSIYFDHDLDRCGTTRTVINNRIVFSNVVHFDPPRRPGPIRRTVPFVLPVVCHYNRYHYSYKIGFRPKIRLRKIHKSMKNREKLILTARNAQWERLSASDQYALGKPMYFQAEALSVSQHERLYVHMCYATAKKPVTSTPQYPVVTNFGCMVESKYSRSRFIPYKNNIVRFTVDSFLFKGITSRQLYMHCTMSVGSSVPMPTAKSCNYDTKAGRWVELYGSDSVCACCDSTCGSAVSSGTNIISSRRYRVKPSATQKRKMVSTTTKTMAPLRRTTTAMAPLRRTTTAMAPLRRTTTAMAPLRRTTTAMAPLRRTTTAMAPLRRTTTARAPLRRTTTARAPLRRTTTARAPLRRTTTARAPLRRTTTARAPLRRTTTARAPLRTTTTARAPLRTTTTARAPLRRTTTARAPLRRTTTARAPLRRTTTARAPLQRTTKEGMISQPEVKAEAKAEETMKELDWPFGGDGVMWVEAQGEEQRQVKGFAVVEEDTKPYRTFEDVFGLDK